jgi:hypothetical protein
MTLHDAGSAPTAPAAPAPRGSLTIRHNHAEGTLLEGSSRGDGVLELTRQHGFRWFRSLGLLGIPFSRDHAARRRNIEAAAAALRSAGFEVAVEIDDRPRPRAEALADQSGRLDDRHERLTTAAARHSAASDAHRNRADQAGERFYMGQPILEGHHSERSALAARARMHAADRLARVEADAAAYRAEQAGVVGRRAARAATPEATARRILATETELRDLNRRLAALSAPQGVELAPAGSLYREELLARRAVAEERLAHDRAELDRAEAAGRYVTRGPHNVHVGDAVYAWHGWRKVLKVNRTTVGCDSGYSWQDKIKFVEIQQVRCPHAPEPLPERITLAEASEALLRVIGAAMDGLQCECRHLYAGHASYRRDDIQDPHDFALGMCGGGPAEWACNQGCDGFALAETVELPPCSTHDHGPLVPREIPAEASAEQVWLGQWWDCPECASSLLVPSTGLRALLAELWAEGWPDR